MKELLEGFPSQTPHLSRLREGVRGMARWEANWKSVAGPVFLGPLPRTRARTLFLLLVAAGFAVVASLWLTVLKPRGLW